MVASPLEKTLQPAPIDAVRDRIAEEIAGRHPGWTVRYDVRGFQARRGSQCVRGATAGALEAKLSGPRS